MRYSLDGIGRFFERYTYIAQYTFSPLLYCIKMYPKVDMIHTHEPAKACLAYHASRFLRQQSLLQMKNPCQKLHRYVVYNFWVHFTGGLKYLSPVLNMLRCKTQLVLLFLTIIIFLDSMPQNSLIWRDHRDVNPRPTYARTCGGGGWGWGGEVGTGWH